MEYGNMISSDLIKNTHKYNIMQIYYYIITVNNVELLLIKSEEIILYMNYKYFYIAPV